MSIWVIVLFAVLIAGAMIGTMHFRGQATLARKNVAILQRLGSSDVIDTDGLLGLKPTRLSPRPALQELLRDAPYVTTLAELLERSGLPTTVAEIYGRMLAVFFVVNVAGIIFDAAGLAAFGASVALAFVPVMWVRRAVNKRADAFDAQLPHALELINMYLRSGRSLPQAFLAAADELHPPCSDEFRACSEEYKLGRPLDSALKKLSQKYPSSIGFRLFSISVTVLAQTGGNMVEVLERIKKMMEATAAYGLRLKALTGESRVSAYILGGMPGFFLCVAGFMNPAYFALFFSRSLGHVLLCILLVLWGGGILWVRALMNSKAV